MTLSKATTDLIQWYEGMLLQPQHFQQADMRHDMLRFYHMRQAFPFFWGVITCKIDEALLTTGTFRPIELEAVLPDGLVVKNAAHSEKNFQLDLTPFAAQLQKSPMKIFLCVPQCLGDSSDVVGDTPRYRSVKSEKVTDVNTGGEDLSIPRLHPNLQLVLADEVPLHYIGLPIAEVSYDTKSYTLTPYISPVLSVIVGSVLGEMCDKLAQKLRQKLGYLQEKVQGALSSSEISSYMAEIETVRLKIIAGLLPYEAVLSTEKSHPFQVYIALSSLSGHLAGIRFGEMPPRFTPYNHENPRESFQQLINFIDNVLDEIQESYSVEVFKQEGRLFTLKLREGWVGNKIVLGVSAGPQMRDDELMEWIANAVIVTDQYVKLAKDNRVLGAERTLVDEVEELSLVPTQGMRLFVVDNDPQYVNPQGVLCLFNASDREERRPQKVVLYNSQKS